MKTLTHGLLIIPTLLACANAPALTTNLQCVADTGLFEHNPDNNLGGMDFVTAGTTGIPSRSRALFKFDVASALPSNGTVTNVTLLLGVTFANGFDQNFTVHRVLRDWGEGTGSGLASGSGLGSAASPGEATWNARFHPDTLWGQPGGEADVDHAGPASASAAMTFSSLEFSSAELIADIQTWLENPATNFGWLLKAANEEPLSASRIFTREEPSGAPVLTIEYSLPSSPLPPTLVEAIHVGDEFQFAFNGEPGLAYTVEFTGEPAGTNWTVLTNIPALTGPATIQVLDSLTDSNRFYRARTP